MNFVLGQLGRFLCACVRQALERERPFVIGVAGSVGKSSTKTALGVALGVGEVGSSVVASIDSFNNELGLPLTILGLAAPGRSVLAWAGLVLKGSLTALGLLKLRARMFVLELGTDRPGNLAYLIKIAKPQVAVLTAIGPEHTEFFGSVTGVAQEEGMIIRDLGPDDMVVINADDPEIARLTPEVTARLMSFGTAEQAEVRLLSYKVRLEEQQPEASGLDVTIAVLGATRTLQLTGTVGRSQAYAVAAALTVVSAIDGDDQLALSRLESRFHGMPGRMSLILGIKRTWLIDDSYNSSPLAALSALRDLAAFPVAEDCRRIAALGDMLELGSLAEEFHTEVGRAVAAAGVDMLVGCGTFAHIVARAARDAGMSDERIFTFAHSADAGRFIQDRLKTGDVVLVKGSQGVRMEKIVRELMAHPLRAQELLVRQTSDWLNKK